MLQYKPLEEKSEIIFCERIIVSEELVQFLNNLPQPWVGRPGKWAKNTSLRGVEITVYAPDDFRPGQERFLKLLWRSAFRETLRLLFLTEGGEEKRANMRTILSLENLTLRSLVLLALGKNFFLRELGNIALDEKGRALVNISNRMKVLIVECPSTKQRTVLFVPVSCTTTEEAMAWMFGFTPEEWAKLSILLET